MVKKLRNKFVMVTTILLLTLFGGFWTVNTLYANYWNGIEIVEMLDWIAYSGIFTSYNENLTNEEEFIRDITKDESPIAGIVIDRQGNIVSAQVIGKDAKMEVPRVILEKMCANKGDKRKIGKYYYSYTVLSDRNILLVIMNSGLEKFTGGKVLGICILFAMGITLLETIIFWLSKFVTSPAEQSLLREKQFISDAGHELKTPLGAISINAQALELEYKDDLYIKNIVSESQRMGRLLEKLLVLAKLDEQEKVCLTKVNLSEICEEMALTYESLAFEKKQSFEFEIAPDIEIYGVEDEVRQLLAILIDNAVKNTDAGGYIFLKCQEVKKHGEITVTNSGHGIPKEFLDIIGRREYDPDALLKLFVMKFKTEYGLDCHAGLHHNKSESNYHIHLIYSERKPLEKLDVKIADRNRFYDETGKHRRTKKEILDADGNIRPGCKIIPKGTHYDCKYFGPKAEQVGDPKFLDEVKHMYTTLINELVKDESERLSVFDRSGPYLATKKIGKNNPKADVIKADNEARMEWNRTVDEARVAGIPEDEIVDLRKDLVSSEIQKSIKENGSKPELLGKIIKNAVATLAEKIKLFKAPKKKIPTFDFAEYNKMVDVNSRLNAVMAAIRKIDSKIEHKQELQKKYRGPKYQNFKVKLIKELGELLIDRRAKQDRLTEIVREAGYKDVNIFLKAFEKSCKLLEEYQAQTATMEKESVVKKLRANAEEAKFKPHKEKDLNKKKGDDPI